jgi:hypothetical protein
MADRKCERIDGFYTPKHPSVTTIIHEMTDKRGLDYWKRKTPNWELVLKQLATTGTLMHLQILQKYSEAQIEMPRLEPIAIWPDGLEEELERRVRSWNALDLQIKNALVEHTVFIDEPAAEAAGSLDLRGDVEGFKAILDLKSSGKIYESQRIQVGGYALGSDNDGFVAERGFIVALRGDNCEVDEIEKDELQEYREKFLDLSREFHRRFM